MEVITEPTTTVFVFASRKPGTTFTHFKTYYEENHAPLVTGLVLKGDVRPLSYTRNYIERDAGADGSPAPSFPGGGAEMWDYDCVTRVVFRDPQHRDAMFTEFAKHNEAIAEDEEKFLDRAKLKVMYVTESPSSVRKD